MTVKIQKATNGLEDLFMNVEDPNLGGKPMFQQAIASNATGYRV